MWTFKTDDGKSKELDDAAANALLVERGVAPDAATADVMLGKQKAIPVPKKDAPSPASAGTLTPTPK